MSKDCDNFANILATGCKNLEDQIPVAIKHFNVRPNVNYFNVAPNIKHFNVGPNIKYFNVGPNIKHFNVGPNIKYFNAGPNIKYFNVGPNIKYFKVGPNICESSVWNLVQISFLTSRVLRRFLDFWKSRSSVF